jgi:hypothetical protein
LLQNITVKRTGEVMSAYCYITFPTTYYAIRAESVLKGSPYNFKMVPVPRAISSSCGTAIRCICSDLAQITSYLIDINLELEGLYQLENCGLQIPTVKELKLDEM